jgi:hypothetical protein
MTYMDVKMDRRQLLELTDDTSLGWFRRDTAFLLAHAGAPVHCGVLAGVNVICAMDGSRQYEISGEELLAASRYEHYPVSIAAVIEDADSSTVVDGAELVHEMQQRAVAFADETLVAVDFSGQRLRVLRAGEPVPAGFERLSELSRTSLLHEAMMNWT